VTAAELWSLPTPRDDELLHVSVPRRSHSPVRGVRLHRRALHPSDVVSFDGIAVTSRLQSTIDCLAWLPYPQAVRLLDDSLRMGVMSREGLTARVAAMARTHGVRQLRRLVADSATGAWSRAERLLHDLLSRAGVDGWVANAPLAMPSGERVVVDVWFSGAPLAVEVDGRAWHVSADRFQGDRTRQNQLLLAGIRVLRFTWDDLTQRPDRVVRTLLGALTPEACGGNPQ